MGKVVAVCSSEKKGTRKTDIGDCEVIENFGLKGDAHGGTWHRQVSLLSYEKIEEFRKRGAQVEFGDFGENLVVDGYDFRTLPIGSRFQCNDVILELTQIDHISGRGHSPGKRGDIMFTGIIEEMGILKNIQKKSVSAVLTVQAKKVLSDVHVGDSIAVNGVCLTVTSFDNSTFRADVMHETLNRSALGSLCPGSPVNLERAMAADGRFGGHIVSGHIDGTGTVRTIERDGNAVWYTICCAPEILRYIIPKGSIGLHFSFH